MRWLSAVVVLATFCTVVQSEPEDGAPHLAIMPRSSVYNIGENKGIYCEGWNIKEKIDWTNPSGKIVDDRSQLNTRVVVERPSSKKPGLTLVALMIYNTTIQDSGNWTCQAGNLSRQIGIVVGEKVRIAVRNEAFVGEEGKTARLDCVAKGYPQPSVQWYKDNMAITGDQKYAIRKRGDNTQLEIRHLSHVDTGEYLCKVTQEALFYYTDKTVSLTVHHKPVLMTESVMEVYAILNETKNISCEVLANPPPTYHWSKRKNGFDEPITAEDTVFTSEDRDVSVLMLRVYGEESLGEYLCVANNSRGHVTTNFHVSLGNKPNPPDFVSLTFANATNLAFNVTCSTCNLEKNESIAPQPDNLPVLGYDFEFAPVQEEYPKADWDMAQKLSADIEDPANTVFVVGPLPNTTTFHSRVCSRNAAGRSSWLDISPDPATTDHAVTIATSTALILTSVACLLF